MRVRRGLGELGQKRGGRARSERSAVMGGKGLAMRLRLLRQWPGSRLGPLGLEMTLYQYQCVGDHKLIRCSRAEENYVSPPAR